MFVGTSLTNIRILHGYTRKQLADKLNITEQSVWQYENGYMSPKMEVVNELKRIFNVKSKYFYSEDFLTKSNCIKINSAHIAYRATIINSAHQSQCEAKHVEFINAFLNLIEKKIIYPKNEILQLREEAIKMLNKSASDRKETIIKVANFARQFLDLNNKGNIGLLFMLEKMGVFVLEKPIGEKIDAYSLWTADERPFIILGNLKQSAVRRNFDLAHELGHLLLHYKVEFSTLDNKSHNEYEREADLFAATLLIPEEEFRKDFAVIAKESHPDSYLDLKRKWFVSVQALAFRAYSLQLMDYQKYRYFNIMINRKGYKVTEPLDNELKINRPGKVRSILQLIFDREYISLNTLLENLKVDVEFLTHLLGIDKDFFVKFQKNTDKQFSVADLSVRVQ